MKIIINIMLAIALLGGAAAQAQTCKDNITPTTPNTNFIDNGDGTVQDKSTGLIWMRCALGQTWDGITCAGSAVTYTWQQALQQADGYTFAASSAWRVPNVKELASILENACYFPAINLVVFPQTAPKRFWTASIYADESANSWFVDFDFGFSYNGSKGDNRYVRLVRATND